MFNSIKKMFALAFTLAILTGLNSCKPKTAGTAVSAGAAEKVYVAPGEYDEYYGFVSGGFSGQLAVYGYPSARLLKVLPVFSVDPEKGYGYSEETRPLLNTSHGFVPWYDLHHLQIFQTDGINDGRRVHVNVNKTHVVD